MSLNSNIIVRQRGKNLTWVSAKTLNVAKGNQETVTWVAEKKQGKKKNFKIKFLFETPFVELGDAGNGLLYHSENGQIGPLNVAKDAAAADYDYELYGQDSNLPSDPKIVVEEPPPGGGGGN